MWKVGHAPLQNNKTTSRVRLKSLLWRLQRNPELFEMYNRVIQEPIKAAGIVERNDNEKPIGEREFYLPHREVVKEEAKSTKLRIVFDGSSKPSKDSPSPNESLELGPPLQNLLLHVLLRNRLKPIALCKLSCKSELVTRIEMHFLWVNNKDPEQVKKFRFTRAVFGLVQTPVLLGATLAKLLEINERFIQRWYVR